MLGLDIRDGTDEVLTVHLRDILAVIQSHVAGWKWSLLHLWAVGELPGERTVVDYEEMASASPFVGTRITERDLHLLASHTDQVIDAVLVGNADAREVMKRSSDDDLYRENELVIEANDSSYWRVVSHRPDIIDALRKHFTDVSPVPNLM
jgi:hypothetical protein